MNERYDQILRLRAIRQYDDRPVDDADLDAIMEAARWTGWPNAETSRPRSATPRPPWR